MQKRMAQRRAKAEKQAALRQKVETQEVDMIKEKLREERTVDQLLIEVDEVTDGPLVARLREWMRRRQELKRDEELRQLADTAIDLDSLTLKKLIIKLDNLEKALRELRRLSAIRGIYLP